MGGKGAIGLSMTHIGEHVESGAEAFRAPTPGAERRRGRRRREIDTAAPKPDLPAPPAETRKRDAGYFRVRGVVIYKSRDPPAAQARKGPSK